MSSFEEHCRLSTLEFGQPYEEVHLWLDEFANKLGYGMRHRKVRHHLEGIKLVRERFGEEAAEAALQHIVVDLQDEGWKVGDPFPKDEKDFVRIGFY